MPAADAAVLRLQALVETPDKGLKSRRYRQAIVLLTTPPLEGNAFFLQSWRNNKGEEWGGITKKMERI